MKESAISAKQAYQKFLEPTKIESYRLFCVLGAVLYSVFISADMVALSIDLSTALLIRGSVVVLLLFSLSMSYLPVFIKIYEVMAAFIFFVTAMGIELMIYLSLPDDHASNVYFAGIVLVMMSLLGWSFLNILLTATILTAISIGYAIISLSKGMVLSELYVNLLFFVGAITIGIAAQMLRSKFLKQIFALKESLADSLKEKTVESSNNAFLANHDALTGLPNRRYMMTLLDELLRKAKRKDKVLALLFADLNGFKKINDIHGHAVGDEVLKVVAQRLSLTIDRCDCLSRLGGDEFLIGIIFDKEYLPRLDNIINRYKASVGKPMKIVNEELYVGASIGVATYPEHGDSISVLMHLADEKMYQAKHESKEGAKPSSKMKHLKLAKNT